MNRRTFLAVTGSSVPVALAGCLDSNDGSGDSDDGDNGQDESPTAAFSWSPDEPRVGEEVEFDAAESQAPGGELVAYNWSIAGDSSEGETVTHTFEEVAEVTVELEVEDDQGRTDTATESLSVGHPEEYETAVNALVELATLLEEAANVDIPLTSADIDDLQSQVETATGAIDDAETAGTQSNLVTSARDVLAFQESLVGSRENALALNPDNYISSASEQLETAIAEASSPGQVDSSVVDDIVQNLDVSEQTDSQRSLIDDLETQQSELDATALDESALTYDGDLSQYLRYAREDLPAIETFIDSNREYFDSFGPLFDGLAAFEDEDFSQAEEDFSTAVSDIEAAITMAEEADTSSSLYPDDFWTQQAQFYEGVRASFQQFVSVATQAADGDVEQAQDEYDSLVDELF